MRCIYSRFWFTKPGVYYFPQLISLHWICNTFWMKQKIIGGRMVHSRFASLFQGPRDDSGIVTAGLPLAVSSRLQSARWPQTVCRPWTPRCGAGAAAPRASWDTEISSPGLDPLIDLDVPEDVEGIIFALSSLK